VPDRRERAQHAGIAQQHVESPEALVQRRAEAIDARSVGDIERHQRGRAALRLDPVVDFLEAAEGAGDQHAVRTFAGEGEGSGGAEAARGAGHQRQTAGQPAGGSRSHPRKPQADSTSSESCRSSTPTWSSSEIG
jgi:hypothetical protein